MVAVRFEREKPDLTLVHPHERVALREQIVRNALNPNGVENPVFPRKIAELLSKEKPPHVQHVIKESDSTKSELLIDLLSRTDCPPELLALLFNVTAPVDSAERGKWNTSFLDRDFVFSKDEYPINTLYARVQPKIRELLRAGQYSLDTTGPEGYNNHEWEHIMMVSIRALRLAKLVCGEHDPDSVIATALTVYIHDLGNIISRKLHQFLSMEVAKIIFPNIRQGSEADREIVDRAEFASYLHTESVAKEALNFIRVIAEIKNVDYFVLVKEILGVETLATIIGDKIHIGPDRSMNTKVATIEELITDKHILLNAVGETTGFEVKENKEDAYWNLNFSFALVEEKYPELVEALRAKNNSRGNVSLDNWTDMFWDLYKDRVELVANCVFALFPQITSFYIKVQSKDNDRPRDGKVESVTVQLRKDHLDEDLEHHGLATYSKKKTGEAKAV